MKKLIIADSILFVLVVVGAICLFSGVRTGTAPPASNTVYVYHDGSAQININNINNVIQTQEDKKIDDMTLKRGTLIIPGDGNRVYYNYPIHNHMEILHDTDEAGKE